jgi:hypothetical protein
VGDLQPPTLTADGTDVPGAHEDEDGLFDGGPVLGTPAHTVWQAHVAAETTESILEGEQGSRWPLVLLILTPLWFGLAWAAAEFLIHLL